MKTTQNLGQSFAELTATALQQPFKAKQDPSRLPPAGLSSGVERVLRGQVAGESLWGSTGTGANFSCKAAATTETQAQYKPPPAGTSRQAPVKPPGNQIPKPDYPAQFKSVAQTDYQPDVLQRAGPPCRGSKLKDSGSPLLGVTDKPAEFSTQAASTFKAYSQAEWKFANTKAAGFPATHTVGYNIIHGGPSAPNPCDAWMPGHDYRKTRPVQAE